MAFDPQILSRVPPQNIEAEMSTLGSMMIDRDALDRGLEILQHEDFYRPTHQDVFDALKELSRRRDAVDLITVQEELRKAGKLEDCGGTEYLMALVDSVPTAANIEYYANIVEQKSILRTLIATGQRLIGLGSTEEDVDKALREAETAVMAVGDRRTASEVVWMSDYYGELFDKLPKFAEEGYLPIYLSSLTKQAVGMFRSDFIVIGARTRIGKSALTMSLLKGSGVKAAYISCEMTKEQIGLREFAQGSGVPVRHMISGKLQQYQYDKIAQTIERLCGKNDIAFYKGVGKTMVEIEAVCRRLVREGVGIVAIDHIHAVTPTFPNKARRTEMEQIARDCKNMALRLNIPVLGLAQFNRDIDRRPAGSRPVLSDITESGAIEAFADVAWLLWRPLSDEEQSVDDVTEAEIHIAKNRMLQNGIVYCGFHGRKFKFVDRAEGNLGL